MPAAYVVEPGATARLSSESIMIEKGGQHLASWELVHLDALALVGRINASMPALHALLHAGIPVALFTSHGRLRGRLVGPVTGHIFMRIGQYALYFDDHQRCYAARRVVAGKIESMLATLARYESNYPGIAPAQVRSEFQAFHAKAQNARSIDILLGLEGLAARRYWAALAACNRSHMPFQGRSARPPRDPINAMLSFGYVLLTQEIAAMLEAVGLDPFVGCYHALKPNRPALAIDVIEPFRHAVIDRMVLAAVNRRQILAADFNAPSHAGVRMTKSGVRKFIDLYEHAMHDAPDPLLLSNTTKSETVRHAILNKCNAIAQAYQRIGRKHLANSNDRNSTSNP